MIGKDTYIIAALNTKDKLRLKKMGQKSLTMAICAKGRDRPGHRAGAAPPPARGRGPWAPVIPPVDASKFRHVLNRRCPLILRHWRAIMVL